MKYGKTL